MEQTRSTPAAPSSIPVLKSVLKWGLLLAAIVAVAGAILGGIFAGGPGIISGLIGAAMAFVFLGITAGSVILANRFEMIGFFAVVLGAWLAKFVLFIVLAITLKSQPWINSLTLFLTLIAGVIASLVVDVIVVAKSRMPYVSDPK